jgi:hypothetical protein
VYHDNVDMKNTEDLSGDTDNNSDTDIGEYIENLTLAGKPIIFKQKMFKCYQFLVQKKSELHV